jgi:multiple sugar transport system ATP-binding protein
MVRVVLENLTKRFGSTLAVDKVNLEIEDKEFFVLLGPSGGGKSTILNMIAGLIPPTDGHIYFDGERVDHLPPEKRDIAMVFQSYALYPHLNVYDNIALGLKVRKVPRDEIDRRVKWATEMLRIDHLIKRKPHELSGGERQRVALARAIVRRPKVWLLDEPMSNIDAKLRVTMRVELIRLQKSLQTTAIYVTHDQVEAMTMADRIGIIHLGKLMQVDKPLNIYRHPRNVFVGGFIGTPPMNFAPCELVEEGGKAYLKGDGFKLEVPGELVGPIKERATDPSDLLLGFRPTETRIYLERQSPGDVEVEIYALEPLGDETIVDFRMGEMVFKATAPAEFPAQMGDRAYVRIEVAESHVFDRKTEECIF